MSRGPTQNTVDVEDRHRFDEASLERFLARELPAFAGGLVVRKFGYGQSNPTFFLTSRDGQKYVLRKKPPGKLIKGAHAVDREFRVMQALGKAGFEVPRMQVFCEAEEVIGTPFYVMDFVQGEIADNGLRNLALERRRPAMLSIVTTLARLHSYDPAGLGLTGGDKPFGKEGGFYERQINTMARTSESQVSGSGEKVSAFTAMPALLKMFAANMPEDRSCVIHGDWKPDNMILSMDPSVPPKVLAVVDWELSTIGHPMSDLANLCLPFHLGQLGSLVSYPAYATDGSVPTEDEIHRAYCAAAKVPFPIQDWSFYIAFSCYRLAVIAQGVAMRAAKGQASQANADQAGLISSVAQGLCDLALKIMSEAYGDASKL